MRGRLWAAVLRVCRGGSSVVVLYVSVQSHGGGTGQPTSSSPPTPAAGPTSSTSPADEVVDAAVSEGGWVPEPITADPESDLRAAIEDAGTVDTTRSTRHEWAANLDTAFTPATRFRDHRNPAPHTIRFLQIMRRQTA